MDATSELLAFLTSGERFPKQTATPVVRPTYQISAEEYTTLVRAVQALANSVQNKLVSGTNIKTINGQPILGEGDISVRPSSIYFEIDPYTGELWQETVNFDDRTQFEIDSNGYLIISKDS